MTEVEAKTKWCPMVRAAVNSDGKYSGPSGFNVGITGHGLAKVGNCIGSGCMMWRGSPADLGVDGPSLSDYGYCGLAGKP